MTVQSIALSDMPNSASGSVLLDVLRKVTTPLLIEECERRGLKVEATDA